MPLILLVEDNERTRRLMRLLLRAEGYALREAGTGAEALAITVETVPDLIVLDIQLPDMSGRAVVAHLRRDSRFALTPIIAVTAYALRADREQCLAAGCSDYIVKPIDTRTFPAVIAAYLAPRPIIAPPPA